MSRKAENGKHEDLRAYVGYGYEVSCTTATHLGRTSWGSLILLRCWILAGYDQAQGG